MEPKISINGKDITSLDDLPEGLKNILADQNKNGVPDIAENPMAMFGKLGDLMDLSKSMGSLPQILNMLQTGKISSEIRKFSINGQTYDSWDQVPEDLKGQLKAKISQLKQESGAESGTEKAQIAFTPKENSTIPTNIAPLSPKKMSMPPVGANPIHTRQESNRRAFFIFAALTFIGWLLYKYVFSV